MSYLRKQERLRAKAAREAERRAKQSAADKLKQPAAAIPVVPFEPLKPLEREESLPAALMIASILGLGRRKRRAAGRVMK